LQCFTCSANGIRSLRAELVDVSRCRAHATPRRRRLKFSTDSARKDCGIRWFRLLCGCCLELLFCDFALSSCRTAGLRIFGRGGSQLLKRDRGPSQNNPVRNSVLTRKDLSLKTIRAFSGDLSEFALIPFGSQTSSKLNTRVRFPSPAPKSFQ
jgi:hypothetical protein